MGNTISNKKEDNDILLTDQGDLELYMEDSISNVDYKKLSQEYQIFQQKNLVKEQTSFSNKYLKAKLLHHAEEYQQSQKLFEEILLELNENQIEQIFNCKFFLLQISLKKIKNYTTNQEKSQVVEQLETVIKETIQIFENLQNNQKNIKTQTKMQGIFIYCQMGDLQDFLEDVVQYYNKADTILNSFLQQPNNNLQSLDYGSITQDNKKEKIQLILSLENQFLKYFKTLQWINILSRFEMNSQALEKIEKYSKNCDEQAETYYQWGLILKRAGKYIQSIEKYKLCIANDNNHKEVYFQYAFSMQQLGNIQLVINLQEKCLELNPNYKNSLINIGFNLCKLGETEKAEQYYKKCIEIYPNCKQAYFNLGIIQKDLEKSFEYFDKCLQIDPNYAKVYISKGQQIIKLGGKSKENQIKAAKYYSIALELNPSYEKFILSKDLKQLCLNMAEIMKQNKIAQKRLKVQNVLLSQGPSWNQYFRKEINFEITEFYTYLK